MRRLAPLLALPLLAGCGPTFDSTSLSASLSPAFANLYVRALEQSGRTDVVASSLSVRGDCSRGGPETLDEGPGDDWACLLSFRDTDQQERQVLYEVTLQPTGCWTAEAPPAVVGDATVPDVDGVRRLNPVYAIDGCLQP